MVIGNTQILDCTLRDGGYLNNWQFSRELASDLYSGLSNANIDYVELGFIYPYEENQGAGMCKCLTEDSLKLITGQEKKSKIAVMIDYGKFSPKLVDADKSCIDLVRVAVHKKDVLDCIPLCEYIQDIGYEVSLQLMNFPSYTEKEVVGVMEQGGFVDYIYIADSFGSMDRTVIDYGFKILKNYNPKIGFHPHNNIQSAFQNTLYTIEKGFDIVDGTVFGLGRGAGNLYLELLLLHLSKLDGHEYKAGPVLDFISKHEEYLMGMQTKKLLYFQMTGAMNLHPNYATEAYERGIGIEYLWDKLKTIDNTTPYKRGML